MPSSPNDAFASLAACGHSRCSSLGEVALRIPRPPPPAFAFSITGYPMASAMRSASATLRTAPSDPAMTGTPSCFIARRVVALSWKRARTSGGGPMKVSPCSLQTSEKSAFSERKPYPGWIACAPESSAADMIAGMFI